MIHQLLTALHIVAIVLFFAAASEDKSDDITVAEWHHGYLGDLLQILSWLLPFGLTLSVVGLIFRVDDTQQHIRQRYDPEYRSPLHVLFAKYLWNIPVVRKIVEFLNRLFGKR